MLKKELRILIIAFVMVTISGIMHYTGANQVASFIVLAATLAIVAMVVGDATEQLGSKLGPGATGVLQSSLGNLPELFVCIFALKAGLVDVVKASLVGSILANSLLVLGAAFLLGGLKNGKQVFNSDPPKFVSNLMLLAMAALIMPTLAVQLHTPADGHINQLDIVVAVVLIIMLAANIYFSIKGDKTTSPTPISHEGEASWPLPTTIFILALAGVAAAFVSEWFVDALTPAMKTLGINETFAGLIIVALAGNAVENVVGIQLAIKNKMDYSVSVILNSSLQIALGLFPILVLLSFVLGGAVLSFVLSPLLMVALFLAVLTSTIIVYDGESVWLEGLCLIGLYAIIATMFWWG